MSTFKDFYIVKWLLLNTERGDIIWQQKESGTLFVDFNEGKNRVQVIVGTAIRPPRVYIKFTSSGLGEVYAQEPLRALFSRKYESGDDEEFAKVIKHLLVVATNQYAQKQIDEIKNEEERKQAIYQRLVGVG